MFIVLFSFLTGCLNQQSFIKDPQGKNIAVPTCSDYVAKYSKVGLNLDILDKYKVAINLSKGIESSLQGLGQIYAIESKTLCENAGTYITLGEGQQYLCRNERLSNSAEQLAIINSYLESIKGIEDAKSKAETIKVLIMDYHDRFLKQLDSPCSKAPTYKLPEDILRDIEKNTSEELKTQRPYISLSSTSILIEGQNAKLSGIIQNTGRTQAIDLTGSIYFVDIKLSEKPILKIPISMGNPINPGMGISNRLRWGITVPINTQLNIATMYVIILLKYQGSDPPIEFSEPPYIYKWASDQSGVVFEGDQEDKRKVQGYINKENIGP